MTIRVIKYTTDRTGAVSCLAMTSKGKLFGLGESEAEALASINRQLRMMR